MKEVKAINLNVRYHLKSWDIQFSSWLCSMVANLHICSIFSWAETDSLTNTVCKNLFHFCNRGTSVFGHRAFATDPETQYMDNPQKDAKYWPEVAQQPAGLIAVHCSANINLRKALPVQFSLQSVGFLYFSSVTFLPSIPITAFLSLFLSFLKFSWTNGLLKFEQKKQNLVYPRKQVMVPKDKRKVHLLRHSQDNPIFHSHFESHWREYQFHNRSRSLHFPTTKAKLSVQ